MSIDSDLKNFAALADLIGAKPAVMLCGFFENPNRRLKIPTQATASHPISIVCGMGAMQRLVEKFGGDAVPLPSLAFKNLHLAGKVFRLRDANISKFEMADLLQISLPTLGEIRKMLGLENKREIADLIEGVNCEK